MRWVPQTPSRGRSGLRVSGGFRGRNGLWVSGGFRGRSGLRVSVGFRGRNELWVCGGFTGRSELQVIWGLRVHYHAQSNWCQYDLSHWSKPDMMHGTYLQFYRLIFGWVRDILAILSTYEGSSGHQGWTGFKNRPIRKMPSMPMASSVLMVSTIGLVKSEFPLSDDKHIGLTWASSDRHTTHTYLKIHEWKAKGHGVVYFPIIHFQTSHAFSPLHFTQIARTTPYLDMYRICMLCLVIQFA